MPALRPELKTGLEVLSHLIPAFYSFFFFCSFSVLFFVLCSFIN